MRNETIVADYDKVTDEAMRLNPAAFPNDSSLLDLNKRANEAIVTNGAPVKINRLHDRDVLAKLNVDNPNGPQLRHVHEVLASCPLELKGRARSRIETTERAWPMPVSDGRELVMQS